MVRILRYQNMRQQRRSGQAAIDRTARCRLLHDALTAAATQLRTNLPDHFEACRNVLQNLGNIFTQQPQFAAAIGAAFLPGMIGFHFTRQLLR